MLSKASYDLIRRVESFGIAMPEDRAVSAEETERLESLADSGYLVRQTLCLPSKESPRGLIGYHVSPAGKDACEQYASHEVNQRAQNELSDKRWRKDATRSWVQWAVTTALTVCTFFAGAVVEKLTGLIGWIVSLLH